MRNTYAEVSLKAIQDNYQVIKGYTGNAKVCAVVKADAYGHGLLEVSKSLVLCGVDYLAVAITEEGVRLREAGIDVPVLVLGSITEDQIMVCLARRLTITASSVEKLRMISHLAKNMGIRATVHLKIDTGMGRIGVHHERADEFLKVALEVMNAGTVWCEGIYSHFSDSLDPEYTHLQFSRFIDVIHEAKARGIQFPLTHICSSRSVFLYPDFHLSMVRPGIALYGIEPDTSQCILPETLKPALSWKTEVVYFKVVKQGEYIGYGKTWSPKEEYERVITLPVGYADGFPRRLSNRGYIIVRGKKYPVVGRVCMDQMMVSLGKTGEAYLGDTVTLIGQDESEKLTAQDIANHVEGAPHEVTTLISSRVPRVYL